MRTRVVGARHVAQLLSLLLAAGCQWMDTRPAVTITPEGDLRGDQFVDLRVDAGGAPRVQLFVDGRAYGETIPTGEVVHLDVKRLTGGEHVLVARVEQGSSPRSSDPRRLLRPVIPPPLPITYTATPDPWSPLVVEFTASIPMIDVAITATGVGGAPVPFTHSVSPDRKQVAVSVGRTLAELQGVNVRLDAGGASGERGSKLAGIAMPIIRLAVSDATPGNLEFTVTPSIPVPGASVWVPGGVRGEYHVMDVGPSPWRMQVADGRIGEGYRQIQFRRPDATIEPVSVDVSGVPGVMNLSIEGPATTLTPSRCATVTSTAALSTASVGAQPTGIVTVSQTPGRWEWRVCPTDSAWKSGPTGFWITMYATSVGGFLFDYRQARVQTGWEWSDPGADPVTDGAAPLRGTVLAVSAFPVGPMRIAYVGAPATPDEARVHVATSTAVPGAFAPGPALNGVPALRPAAALRDGGVVAWVRGDGSDLVEGAYQYPRANSWVPWSGGPDPILGPAGPAVAYGPGGRMAAAWSTRWLATSQAIRLRRDASSWQEWPTLDLRVQGPPLEIQSLSVNPAVPGFGAPAIGLVSGGTSGSLARGFTWDSSGWSQTGPDFAWSSNPAPVPTAISVMATESTMWAVARTADGNVHGADWRASRGPYWSNLGQLNGTGAGLLVASAPEYLRSAFLAYTIAAAGGATEIWIAPLQGTGGVTTLIATVTGRTVTALALDADSMAVAWSESDGTIHVRTLVP